MNTDTWVRRNKRTEENIKPLYDPDRPGIPQNMFNKIAENMFIHAKGQDVGFPIGKNEDYHQQWFKFFKAANVLNEHKLERRQQLR